MPGIREVRQLPYSAEQMFDLVADVSHYSDFLPWVMATRVRSDSASEMVADMLVGFKTLREKFTSRVTKDRPREIKVHYLDGPLKDLDNLWLFTPVGEGCCEVDFSVDFTFKNRMFEKLAGQYFEKAFHKMVSAFEEQAAKRYGSKSSSATRVA